MHHDEWSNARRVLSPSVSIFLSRSFGEIDQARRGSRTPVQQAAKVQTAADATLFPITVKIGKSPKNRPLRNVRTTQHLATRSVSSREIRPSRYFRRSLSSRFAPTEPRSTEPKRGPDEIRTRICDHREVLCCPYATGPTRIIPRIVARLYPSSHSAINCWFTRKSGNPVSLLESRFTAP